ncbi:MAG: PP2C family protein-serine/threonine phosphatase [Phycisphaerales bacterium]
MTKTNGAAEMSATHDDDRLMKCMEVWGGNQAANGGVVMAGLDAWIYSRPFEGSKTGGDVHYVSSCATGRVTRLLVADVSGHGAAVSDTADRLRSLMRRYVNHIDQRRFVEALNHEFMGLVREGGFATAVVGTFFGPMSELSVTIAGHPPPLVYRAKRKSWSFIESPRSPDEREVRNPPLGVLDEIGFDDVAIRLGVGDLVLFYTDSLMEARTADGVTLGLEGLKRLVESTAPEPSSEFVERLLARLAEESGREVDGDDVTALLFRPNGLAPRVPLRDRALAPFRVAGGVLRDAWRSPRSMPWPEMSIASLGGAMFMPLNRLRRRSSRAQPAREDG